MPHHLCRRQGELHMASTKKEELVPNIYTNITHPSQSDRAGPASVLHNFPWLLPASHMRKIESPGAENNCPPPPPPPKPERGFNLQIAKIKTLFMSPCLSSTGTTTIDLRSWCLWRSMVPHEDHTTHFLAKGSISLNTAPKASAKLYLGPNSIGDSR